MNKSQGKPKYIHKIVGISILGVLSTISFSAFAGGFQLFEQNVTNLGNSYAGMSAQADDASTEFYNPAGMTRLDNPQVVGAVTWIDVGINAHATSATNTETVFVPVFNIPVATIVTPVTGSGNNLQPGQTDPVPAFHFVYPFSHKFAVGFGITSPFGLDTIYPDTTLQRYLATKSSVEDINLSLDIAYQFNDHFSLGIGPDSQYLSATLDQAIPGF